MAELSGQAAILAKAVSYWRFEGNSNDAVDSNNGSDTAITYGTDYGKYSQGGSFNGSSSVITMANNANLQITGALTIAGWIKPNTTTGQIFCKGDDNSWGGVNYMLSCNSNQIMLRVAVDSNPGFSVIGSTTLTNGVWYHVAGIYIPSTSLKVYVNGVEDGSNTTSIPAAIKSTTDTPAIGRDGDLARAYFTGSIDDLAIFNTNLSTEELLTLATDAPAETTQTGYAYFL